MKRQLLIHAFLIACCAATVLTAAWIPLARRFGFLDNPGPRKVHSRPTPRGGGIAIYLSAALGALLLRPDVVLHSPGRILFGVGGVIALLGLVDDWRPLSWQLRLPAHLLAATAAMGLAFAPASWLVWTIGVFWIAGLTNAFNMLDNMDTLSAGTAWIAVAALVVLWLGRQEEAASTGVILCALLLGALTGFLWFNRPPAQVFMGDAGSTFLGFFLGVAALDVVWPIRAAETWLVPAILLAVPCYDVTSVVLIRLRQGRNPFRADKQHVSHRLVALGLSSSLAVGIIHGLALLCGIGAIALTWATTASVWWLVIALLVTLWIGIVTFDVIATSRRPREEMP